MQGHTSEVYPPKPRVPSIYCLAVNSTKIAVYYVVCRKYGSSPFIQVSPSAYNISTALLGIRKEMDVSLKKLALFSAISDALVFSFTHHTVSLAQIIIR